MALRTQLLLTNLVPALRRAAISTSPVIESNGGERKLAQDAAIFAQLLKRDAGTVIIMITALSLFGYTKYSVRNLGYLETNISTKDTKYTRNNLQKTLILRLGPFRYRR